MISLLILWPLVYLWAFWGAYVLVIGLYRAHLVKRLTWVTYFLSVPFLALGVLMDTVANLLIASVIFWELPRECLVTQRLTRLKKQNT